MGCSFSSFEPDRISMRMKWGNDYGHTKGTDIAWQHAASASLSYSNIITSQFLWVGVLEVV